MLPVSNTRKFGFLAKMAAASSVTDGAIITSVKIDEISAAVSASNVWFIATMPPNALTGSADKASVQAACNVERLATPHGLACLIIAIVGALNSAAKRKAASVSLILL